MRTKGLNGLFKTLLRKKVLHFTFQGSHNTRVLLQIPQLTTNCSLIMYIVGKPHMLVEILNNTNTYVL